MNVLRALRAAAVFAAAFFFFFAAKANACGERCQTDIYTVLGQYQQQCKYSPPGSVLPACYLGPQTQSRIGLMCQNSGRVRVRFGACIDY